MLPVTSSSALDSQTLWAQCAANAVAEAAEAANHIPISPSRGMCAVEIWTHDISGLAEGDFTLAATIGTPLRAGVDAVHDLADLSRRQRWRA